MNTTHIGSLPFLQIKDAVDFNKGLSLPALPTLPMLDDKELMINQFTNGLMSADYELPFCCYESFFKDFNGNVKVQVCGIQTLYNNLPSEIHIDEFINWYSETVNLFTKNIPTNFVLFFDEPDLRNLNPKLWSYYNLQRNYPVGIHSCANAQWSELDLSHFNHISFDSFLISNENLLHLKNLSKTLYYGDISTSTGETKDSQLTENDFRTPNCGLALSDLKTLELIKLSLTK